MPADDDLGRADAPSEQQRAWEKLTTALRDKVGALINGLDFEDLDPEALKCVVESVWEVFNVCLQAYSFDAMVQKKVRDAAKEPWE